MLFLLHFLSLVFSHTLQDHADNMLPLSYTELSYGNCTTARFNVYAFAWSYECHVCIGAFRSLGYWISRITDSGCCCQPHPLWFLLSLCCVSFLMTIPPIMCHTCFQPLCLDSLALFSILSGIISFFLCHFLIESCHISADSYYQFFWKQGLSRV